MSSIEFVNCIFSNNNNFKTNKSFSYFLLGVILLTLSIMISCARRVENFHKQFKIVKLNGKDYIVRKNQFSY
jgi:magnesium-transporting ATPase (P-type)